MAELALPKRIASDVDTDQSSRLCVRSECVAKDTAIYSCVYARDRG